MATIPQHVKIARKDGAVAGVESLHDTLSRNTNDGTNGLPQAQEMLATIRKQGGYRKRDGILTKPEKAATWYCNHFNPRFKTANLPLTKEQRTSTGGKSRKAKAQETAPAVNTEALIALASALGIEIPNVEVDEDDEQGEGDEDTGTTRRVNRPTAATETETQVYPPPRDPDAPATQGKLWKLNAEGPDNGLFLCVIDEDGNILAGGESPLTAGECYDLIGEHIAA